LIEESLSEFAVRESGSRQAEVCQRIGGGNFLRQTKAFICSLLSITRPSWCQAFCHANIDVLRVLVAAFSFSLFSGLVGENRLFRPFVFSMFSGLACFSSEGHNVATKFAENSSQ